VAAIATLWVPSNSGCVQVACTSAMVAVEAALAVPSTRNETVPMEGATMLACAENRIAARSGVVSGIAALIHLLRKTPAGSLICF
jgi:hypothetical protein